MPLKTKKKTKAPGPESEQKKSRISRLRLGQNVIGKAEPQISKPDDEAEIVSAETLLRLEPEKLRELLVSVEEARKMTSYKEKSSATDIIPAKEGKIYKKKTAGRFTKAVIGAVSAAVIALGSVGLVWHLGRDGEASEKKAAKRMVTNTVDIAISLEDKARRACLIPGNLKNVEMLVEFCANPSTTPCSKENTMRVIEKMGGKTVSELLNILETTDSRKKALIAAEALGRICPVDALEKLAKIIINPEAKYREEAAAAFTGIVDGAKLLKPERIDTFGLLVASRDDKGKITVSREAYIAAVIGIGKTTHPNRIDALEAIIKVDYCKDCNYPQAWKLDPYGEGMGVHPAVVALVGDVQRRAQMLMETWKINTSKRSAVMKHPAVITFLESKNVKRTLELLAEYTKKGNNPNLRKDAIWGLGELGIPQTTKVLLPLLNDKNREIRLAAVTALANTSTENAIPGLTRVAKKETDEEICNIAKIGLERITGVSFDELEMHTNKKKTHRSN
jgi:HEAT repeat protein